MSAPPAHLTPDLPPPPFERRYLALWFPYWHTDASMVAHERAQPFVLVTQQQGGQRLAAANAAAQAAGLAAGMTLADARALVPCVQTAMLDVAASARRLRRCAASLQSFTPWVGEDRFAPQDGLMLDVSGCAHLFGGERKMLAEMRARFARSNQGEGVGLSMALAGTPGAAWGLAHYGGGQGDIIVPPGHEAEAVLELPVAALRLEAAQLDLCRRLGLVRIADLARFPRHEITRRFGALPILRMEQAFGQAGESVNPYLPPPRFQAIRNLAQSVTQIEAVQLLVDTLCTTLAAQLHEAGRGAQALDLLLTRSDNARLRLHVPLAHPSADAAHMARLFAERFARLQSGFDAGFGIETLVLMAQRHAPLAPPQDALALQGRGRKSVPVAALARFADRLVSRLGARAVVRPVSWPSHIPERAASLQSLTIAPLDKQDEAAANDSPASATRPLFLLCAPEPIEVIAEIPEGAPFRFRWRRVLHEVVAAQGPERIGAEWWRQAMSASPDDTAHNIAGTRDYFRIEDANGHRFWLYRDGLYGRETLSPRWFMHGVFP
jgi:protein ImuB